MKNIYLLVLAAFLFSSGCSGFMLQSNRESTTTEPISDSAYKVVFSGAGYMPKQRAENTAMIRASELTLKKGFTHFVIMQKSMGSGMNQLEDIPRDTYQKGMKQSSTERLACPQNLMRPVISLKIQCYSAKDAPTGAIDAKQYLNDNPPD